MKILMLVNWKVEYVNEVPVDKQPPDYVVLGKPYWFFRYFERRNNEEYLVDVVDVRSIPFWERVEKNRLRFYVWQTLKVLSKLNQYDLVISHGMQSGIVLCLWRRLFGKGRYKHIVFDIGAFNSAKEEGKALKVMQFASKSLDGVIYHTALQKKYYEKCYPWLVEKSKYITFGTDTEFFENVKEQNGETGSGYTPYILSVGYDKRDWETLVKAYDELDTDIPLRLIGNKEFQTDNPKIEVWDKVNIVELKRQIENAFFCVLPLKSFNYSYGQMTLLQQMAMRKAVIVADVPSIAAYRREKNIVLYEPENVKMLKEQMQELVYNREWKEEIERNAERTVKEIFNERNMALEIEKMIIDTMEK